MSQCDPASRVLVTGAGGPAGIAVMKSLGADQGVRLVAADMDAWAAGLYLVPLEDRALVPAGGTPGFARHLLACCREMSVDAVIPTVDAELRPLAKARGAFERNGVRIMLAPDQALRLTLDKLALMRFCADVVRVPRTEPFDTAFEPDSWEYPAVLKPRAGSGSRNITIVRSAADLNRVPRSPSLIVQEYLPGDEYSIDVLADRPGHVIAAVPRLRAKVDAGISVAGRTVRDDELESFGAAVAELAGISYIANVQARRDAEGRPALLEANPRAPGSLALTIASGVDMPRLAMDALRGQAVPEHVGFREIAMVRFLDERVFELGEMAGASR